MKGKQIEYKDINYAEHITILNLETAISNGEILEDYPKGDSDQWRIIQHKRICLTAVTKTQH